MSMKRKRIRLSQRTLKSFPRGQRKAKNQKPLELFDINQHKLPGKERTHSREKLREGRLTTSHKADPAKDVLDKLPRIMGEHDWGIKWLQKQS